MVRQLMMRQRPTYESKADNEATDDFLTSDSQVDDSPTDTLMKHQIWYMLPEGKQ